MERTINISKLLKLVGIEHTGNVQVAENMSGLEPNPKDDWLYLCVLALKDLANREGANITSIANIGSGNGIETIVELKLFKNLKKVIVTDIIPDILPQIQRNIEVNARDEIARTEIAYMAGRDAEPVTEKVDLIYANLPLIMVDKSDIHENRATTTLTDSSHYEQLSEGRDDLLTQYSLLSQLGFLLGAKEKLNARGHIITLIGGRVPSEALTLLFERAGFSYREIVCAFKLQSDPEFLKQYAEYETKTGAKFFFYDYAKAVQMIKDELNIVVPDVIDGMSGNELKQLLAPVRLNARQAYEFALENKPIGHIAFAFEAKAK